MNQQQIKHLRLRLTELAKQKIEAIKNEDQILFTKHNKNAELTTQEIIDCLSIDVKEFTDPACTKTNGVNIPKIREYLNKPDVIPSFVGSKSPKEVIFENLVFDFSYSEENANRARQVIAHLNVAIDSIVLGTAEDAHQYLKDFQSKIF